MVKKIVDAKKPPHVRSFLPYVGSAIEMGQDIHAFITGHGQRLNNTPIFSAHIAGHHCYFLADPDLVLTLPYKSGKVTGLDADVLAITFGERVLSLDHESAAALTAPSASKLYSKFFFAKDQLELAVPKMQVTMNQVLEEIQETTLLSNAFVSASLYEFVSKIIFRSSVDPLISKAIATNEMAFLFNDFEPAVPLLFAGLPNFLLKKSVDARETMLSKYMGGRADAQEYLKDAGPLIQTRREEFAHWDEAVHNRSEVGILFAAVGNSIPTVFWTTMHVLNEPDAMKAIQEEIQRIGPPKGADGTSYTTEQLDDMEVIHGVFFETLRLYHAACIVRMVVDDNCIVSVANGTKYRLDKGSRVMSYSQVVHKKDSIFTDPHTFIWNRFLRDPETKEMPQFELPNGKKVTNPPLRFFGNGAYICPGRRFIAYELKAYLAFLFQRFDMRLPATFKHPGIDKAMDGIGVSHPDGEVTIEIRPKA